MCVVVIQYIYLSIPTMQVYFTKCGVTSPQPLSSESLGSFVRAWSAAVAQAAADGTALALERAARCGAVADLVTVLLAHAEAVADATRTSLDRGTARRLLSSEASAFAASVKSACGLLWSLGLPPSATRSGSADAALPPLQRAAGALFSAAEAVRALDSEYVIIRTTIAHGGGHFAAVEWCDSLRGHIFAHVWPWGLVHTPLLPHQH